MTELIDAPAATSESPKDLWAASLAAGIAAIPESKFGRSAQDGARLLAAALVGEAIVLRDAQATGMPVAQAHILGAAAVDVFLETRGVQNVHINLGEGVPNLWNVLLNNNQHDATQIVENLARISLPVLRGAVYDIATEGRQVIEWQKRPGVTLVDALDWQRALYRVKVPFERIVAKVGEGPTTSAARHLQAAALVADGFNTGLARAMLNICQRDGTPAPLAEVLVAKSDAALARTAVDRIFEFSLADQAVIVNFALDHAFALNGAAFPALDL